MFIKNLKLGFDREEKDKIVFKTENGLEIFFAKDILNNFVDYKSGAYLTLDKSPISTAEPKEILDELLKGDE